MGRPSKLDDIVAQRIVAAIEKGLPRKMAAQSAGVHVASFYGWMARGKSGEPGYVEFFERVRKAEAAGVEALISTIKEHSFTTWQAAAWLLERMYPALFALRRPAPESSEKPLTDEQAREEYKRITGREFGT